MADLVVSGYLLEDSASVGTAQIAVDVGKDLLFGLFLQDDLATEGRIGEASLYLFPDVARVSAYEGLEAILVAKLGNGLQSRVR